MPLSTPSLLDRETHYLAEAQHAKNEKMRMAFGIPREEGEIKGSDDDEKRVDPEDKMLVLKLLTS